MKLQRILFMLHFVTFTHIFCNHNENHIDPVQAYLTSNLIASTQQQKHDLCSAAFHHVWEKANGTTKSKQATLYSICKHAHKYKHDVNSETAQCFFNVLKLRLMERLTRDVIKLPESLLQKESIHLTRSEKQTKKIAFCCEFVHQKITTEDNFNFDNPHFFNNKESYCKLLQQVQATVITNENK